MQLESVRAQGEADRRIHQKELQKLSEQCTKLDDECNSSKRRIANLEESNDFLRQQLVDARREIESGAAGRRDMMAMEQVRKKDADIIKNLTQTRDEAVNRAAIFHEKLKDQTRAVARLSEQLAMAQKRAQMSENSTSDDGAAGDLLQLIQLFSAADKRAEEAEAAYKTEQQAVWRLRQEFSCLEQKLVEYREGRRSYPDSRASGSSPKIYPQETGDSASSMVSGRPTLPSGATSTEYQQTRRELKVNERGGAVEGASTFRSMTIREPAADALDDLFITLQCCCLLFVVAVCRFCVVCPSCHLHCSTGPCRLSLALFHRSLPS